MKPVLVESYAGEVLMIELDALKTLVVKKCVDDDTLVAALHWRCY